MVEWRQPTSGEWKTRENGINATGAVGGAVTKTFSGFTGAGDQPGKSKK